MLKPACIGSGSEMALEQPAYPVVESQRIAEPSRKALVARLKGRLESYSYSWSTPPVLGASGSGCAVCDGSSAQRSLIRLLVAACAGRSGRNPFLRHSGAVSWWASSKFLFGFSMNLLNEIPSALPIRASQNISTQWFSDRSFRLTMVALRLLFLDFPWVVKYASD
jgi:hypothetical protein